MRNFGYVTSVLCVIIVVAGFDEHFSSCPSISKGYPPFCKCRYGPAYDNITNTCPNPECPTASIAQPSYPNCTCTEKNSEYSAYINDCFRSCPEDSTGYWPTCTCDDKLAIFDKEKFKCLKCPENSDEDGIYPSCTCSRVGAYNIYKNECTQCAKGSTGLYPNCLCDDEYGRFNSYLNICEYCPEGSKGKPPDCICDDGGEYNKYSNNCEKCPFDSIGIYPKCECLDGAPFVGNVFFKYCLKCPWGSSGSYGNCVCGGNLTYDKDKNWCYECPPHSLGTYPSCICEEPYQYIEDKNLCLKCPDNSNGTYPNCECDNGLFAIRTGQCIECPSNTTGVYPDCECEVQDHLHSAYINVCYIECGSDSTGLYPRCNCDKPGKYYDPEEFVCKSNVGRECPIESIGVGPDCLCVDSDYIFFEIFWSCYPKNVNLESPSTAQCPEGGNKWPQCNVEIDHNTLLSLIG